jgi:hypothetical protein
MTCDRSLGTPVSSINKTDHHDITEIQTIVENGIKHHKPQPPKKRENIQVIQDYYNCHMTLISLLVIHRNYLYQFQITQLGYYCVNGI